MTNAFRPHGLRTVLWMLLIAPLLLAGPPAARTSPPRDPGYPRL